MRYVKHMKQEQFDDGLKRLLAKKGRPCEITALELHKLVGGYPEIKRFPMACAAMYAAMQPGDEVLYAPPSGLSSTVKILYK